MSENKRPPKVNTNTVPIPVLESGPFLQNVDMYWSILKFPQIRKLMSICDNLLGFTNSTVGINNNIMQNLME